MSDPRLVDMEPGGESTQYESIRLYTKSPAKQTGQLGAGGEHTTSAHPTTSESATDNADVDDETLAQKLGDGTVETGKGGQSFDDAEAAKTRRQQGYGPGSNVGA